MKTYDPAQYVFNFKGLRITGYAPEQFITVTQNNDTYTGIVGADGEPARARMNDESGLVSVILLETSESVGVLDSFRRQDAIDNTGFGELLVQDLLGADEISCGEAFIVKPPDINKDLEVGTREFAFWCGRLVQFQGPTTNVLPT